MHCTTNCASAVKSIHLKLLSSNELLNKNTNKTVLCIILLISPAALRNVNGCGRSIHCFRDSTSCSMAQHSKRIQSVVIVHAININTRRQIDRHHWLNVVDLRSTTSLLLSAVKASIQAFQISFALNEQSCKIALKLTVISVRNSLLSETNYIRNRIMCSQWVLVTNNLH